MVACNPKRFVLAGPLRSHHDVGGIVILFEDLSKSVGTHTVIFDTNGKNFNYKIVMIVGFFMHCIKAIKSKYELALHGTANDFVWLGVLLLFFNVFFNVKYHTRKFAGNFDVYYENLNPLLKYTTRKFLQYSECNFFEPMYLVSYFKPLNPNTHWFPNYRSKSTHRALEQFSGKFVFVGHVKKEKGVDTLLELSTFLENGWTIDIYGPLTDYMVTDLPHEGSVVYKGTLQPEDVQKVLSGYNCLILPSYREGYPGVIIEAFSVGLPVIASKLSSLQEMIDETSGVLIEPGSAPSVLEAMQEIATNYSHYRNGSLKRFVLYEKEKVLNNYLSVVGMDKMIS